MFFLTRTRPRKRISAGGFQGYTIYWNALRHWTHMQRHAIIPNWDKQIRRVASSWTRRSPQHPPTPLHIGLRSQDLPYLVVLQSRGPSLDKLTARSLTCPAQVFCLTIWNPSAPGPPSALAGPCRQAQLGQCMLGI